MNHFAVGQAVFSRRRCPIFRTKSKLLRFTAFFIVLVEVEKGREMAFNSE